MGTGNDDWMKGIKLFPLPAVMVGTGLLIHIPFLHWHGAQTWPGPDLSAQGLWTSTVFLVLTLAIGAGSRRACRDQPKRRVALALFAWGLLLGAVHFAFGLPRVWFLLLYMLSASLGWRLFCQLVDRILELFCQKTASEAIEGLLCRLLPLAALCLVCASAYSLSLYDWLPSEFGGEQSRYVRFVAKPGLSISSSQLRRFGHDNLTQPMLLLYSDQDHYWLECYDDVSACVTVRRVKAADFGEPLPCPGWSPPKMRDRPKRWAMEIREIPSR